MPKTDWQIKRSRMVCTKWAKEVDLFDQSGFVLGQSSRES